MGIKGRLEDIALVEIIEVFSASRETAAVHLSSEEGHGLVYLKDGVITHATFRDLRGKAAFDKLIAIKEGDFDVERGLVAGSETIPPDKAAGGLKGAAPAADAAGMAVQTASIEVPHPPAQGTLDPRSDAIIDNLLELGILEKSDGRN
ncbi:MAG TPA: DUF4388 domain-containing protein [Deltaproteobacteria bacterium]|nr:DUF4388 domain-containing protein [Deltaproteobacteria bacterium]